MEFKYLAKLTHKKEYFLKVALQRSKTIHIKKIQVDHIMGVLERHQESSGLWPTYWNATTGTPINSRYNHYTKRPVLNYFQRITVLVLGLTVL
jgi:hypothetical protein